MGNIGIAEVKTISKQNYLLNYFTACYVIFIQFNI